MSSFSSLLELSTILSQKNIKHAHITKRSRNQEMFPHYGEYLYFLLLLIEKNYYSILFFRMRILMDIL